MSKLDELEAARRDAIVAAYDAHALKRTDYSGDYERYSQYWSAIYAADSALGRERDRIKREADEADAIKALDNNPLPLGQLRAAGFDIHRSRP